MPDGSIALRGTLIVSLLALAGSSVAVATSWGARRRATSTPTAGPPSGDVEDVERRVRALERQVEILRVAVAARAVALGRAAPPPTTSAAPIPADAMADLDHRLVRLEQLASQIQASHSGGHPLSPEAMAAATRTVLDRHLSTDERAAALNQLRPIDGRSDGRTHEVVTAALELIQAPETAPKVRAGMIRDLDRLKDPVLKDPLMGILSQDGDGRTRREVVETLAVFYDDEQVRSQIERLKDTDPEPQVRAQAIKQLGRWKARGQ
jgi:HEAT repeat protein